MLQIDKLAVAQDDRVIFNDLSFKLSNQEILYVSGCNGIGKTTLLRTIAGLNNEFSGKITWNGSDCSTKKNYDYYNSLDFIGHKLALKLELNPIDNLSWRNKLYIKATLTQKLLLGALDKMGVVNLAYISCGYLSCGQLRKIALASLLLNNTVLWILDEPFTALDDIGIIKVYTILEQHLANNGMIIISSHQRLKQLPFTIKQINLEDYSPRLANIAKNSRE